MALLPPRVRLSLLLSRRVPMANQHLVSERLAARYGKALNLPVRDGCITDVMSNAPASMGRQ